jgi:hypothetical protein
MRWITWASTLSVLLLFQSAISYAGCSSCNGNDSGSYRAYRGAACYSPPGYCLSPGCCECPPSACDNAWDGYCEQKAKWQAFFTKVGTPKVHCHGCPCMTPAEGCAYAADTQTIEQQQPTPAVKPTNRPTPLPSAPTPSKASWWKSPTGQWYR